MFDAYFNLFLGMVLGSLLTIWYIRHNFRIEKPWPYSWSCEVPGCKAGVATTSDDPEFIMRAIEIHKGSHINEKRSNS